MEYIKRFAYWNCSVVIYIFLLTFVWAVMYLEHVVVSTTYFLGSLLNVFFHGLKGIYLHFHICFSSSFLFPLWFVIVVLFSRFENSVSLQLFYFLSLFLLVALLYYFSSFTLYFHHLIKSKDNENESFLELFLEIL